MNTVQMAINRVTRVIPKRILEDTFLPPIGYRRMRPKSVEQYIREEVILKRVLPDCNLENGVYTKIPLSAAILQQQDVNGSVYYFPKSATGGRSIITALDLEYGIGQTSYYNTTTCGVSPINLATQALNNATAGAQITSNTRVDLIGENTILVVDSAFSAGAYSLVCILDNDEELSTIRPKSIPIFIQLIVLATKSYIYNKMNLEVNTAQLQGGVELGRYREIIDSYADSEELYNQMLDEKIGKMFYMNDGDNMTKHIRLMLGGRR